MRKIFITYNDLHNECINYANSIIEQDIKFDCVVGLARGGIFPSMLISRVLDIPLHIVNYSSVRGQGDNKDYTNTKDIQILHNKKILLVDDIVDSGWTLNDMCCFYECFDNSVTTYAVYYKTLENPIHVPNYSIGIPEDSGWVVFPFEELYTL